MHALRKTVHSSTSITHVTDHNVVICSFYGLNASQNTPCLTRIDSTIENKRLYAENLWKYIKQISSLTGQILPLHF